MVDRTAHARPSRWPRFNDDRIDASATFGTATHRPAFKSVPPEALVAPSADTTTTRITATTREYFATGPIIPRLNREVKRFLRKLAALRDDGLITAEEFEAKKKQLLGIE